MRGGDRALGRQPPVSHPHTHESVHKTMNSAWETKEGLPGALGEQLAGQGAGGAGLDLKRPDPERPSKEGDWGRRLQRPGHPSGLLVPPKFRIPAVPKKGASQCQGHTLTHVLPQSVARSRVRPQCMSLVSHFSELSPGSAFWAPTSPAR